jgi:hypothetical protein
VEPGLLVQAVRQLGRVELKQPPSLPEPFQLLVPHPELKVHAAVEFFTRSRIASVYAARSGQACGQ